MSRNYGSTFIQFGSTSILGLFLFFNSPEKVIRMCREFAAFLVFVGALVFLELRNPDKVLPVHLVKTNQPSPFQFSEKRCNVHIVEREYLPLNFPWAIFQTAFPVRHHPEAGKKKTRNHRTIGKLIILEETWLYVTRSHGFPPPTRQSCYALF